MAADRAAVEFFRSISSGHWSTALPPVFDMPGADTPVPLRQAINHYAYETPGFRTCWPVGRWTRWAGIGLMVTCLVTIRRA